MTRRKVQYRKTRFLQIDGIPSLASLMGLPLHTLQLQASYPAYNEFKIPKSNGGFRHIEDPRPVLKQVQRILNKYLQSVYFTIRTSAAYGFLIDVKRTKDRTIFTNALQHMGCAYMTNMDYQDFFHSITQEAVVNIFLTEPFLFSSRLSKHLAALCCYKGRLPMGAPTSPILSNFYCIQLDRKISAWCKERHITFTRFADDMSFSSKQRLDAALYPFIENLSKAYRLTINPSKTKYYGLDDQKIVTGIYVSDKLDVHPSLVADTLKEIDKLGYTLRLNRRYNPVYEERWIRHHKQKINGLIQFTKQVKGKNDPDYQSLIQAYGSATDIEEVDDPISWKLLPSTL